MPVATDGELARPIILVTGVPASGKTTLARSLVPLLGLPLLSKDVVKESLFDCLGVGDRAWALRISEAALAVLWSLLPGCPAGAIIDLWLDPIRDAGLAERGLASTGIDRVLEIQCVCPGNLAADRYAARIRHAGHLAADETTLQRIRDAATLMRPLGLGPCLRVDTRTPVDVEAVRAWVDGQAGIAG